MRPYTKTRSNLNVDIPRLPDPTQHARRQRDATARQVETDGADLLYVSSLAGQFAVLKQADGTVLDQEIAVATDVLALRPGDRVVRLAIPGKGDRDARGSYVAIGPVAPIRAVPVMTPGAAMGSGPSAITVQGEDDFVSVEFQSGSSPTARTTLLTLTWAAPVWTSRYGLVVLARNVASADALRLGYWTSGPTTTQTSLGVVGPLVANTSYWFLIGRLVNPP